MGLAEVYDQHVDFLHSCRMKQTDWPNKEKKKIFRCSLLNDYFKRARTRLYKCCLPTGHG